MSKEMRNLDGFFGLYFASLPNLEELTAVKFTIQTKEGDEITAIQPMCCRELIFTEPKVLVSPLLEDRNKLFLITQKALLHSSQFQELLQKLNISLQETEQVDLTENLFQFCFSFTMKQKLAPLWNKAGDFLVQGRDFVQEKSKLNAVSLEVTISDKICIGLQAYSLKSTPCKPEHFTASTRTLEEFNTNKNAVITDAAISDDLCFVLPSLKKGRIFSITHNLPKKCPFASYEDLRKHWKLMYGYRLPAEENVFYNVHFYYIRGKIFTYPASCIRSSQALVSPRCNHQLIFNSFLRDLFGRMPSVCGTPLAFTSSPLYPTNRLLQATHVNHSNLTRTTPQLNHCRPFAIQEKRTRDYIRQADASPSASLMSSQTATSSQIHQTESDETTNRQRTTPSVDQQKITPSFSQTRTPSGMPLFSSLPSGTRFVPRFTSSRLLNSNRAESVYCNSNRSSTSAARIVPMFSKKRVQSRENEPTRKSAPMVTTAASRVYFVGNVVQQNATSLASSQPSPYPVRRMENTSQLQSQQRSSQNNLNNLMGRGISRTMQGDRGEISSSFNQELMIDSIVTNSPATIHKNVPPVAHSAGFSTHVSKRLPQKRPGLVITQAAAPGNGHLVAPFTGSMTQKPKESTINLTEQESNWGGISSLQSDMSDTTTSRLPISGLFRERTTTVQQLQSESFSSQSQSSADLTWNRQVGDSPHEEPPPKKLKSKPKIQENIDVRELAFQDQLHKINAFTLANWLKKRGVAVKSKDKKAELTSKVKQHLGLVPHEQ